MTFKVPRTIRVKVQDPVGTWFASSLITTKRTDEQHVKALNDTARSRRVMAVYSLATEEEYQAYRAETKTTTKRRNTDFGDLT